MMVATETKDGNYILGNEFGDRADVWKKESGMVFRFLT